MSSRRVVGVVSALAMAAATVSGVGCSSSSAAPTGTATDAGTDSGTAPKPDTGVSTKDSGTKPPADVGSEAASDDTGASSFDADESDAPQPPGCYQATAFTPVPWAPPTPLHQGACTTAELTAYGSSLTMALTVSMLTATSGNAACDACLQTDVAAAAHGPVVTEVGQPIGVNVGGCVASIDGNAAAGSCGNTLTNQADCIQQECGMCTTPALATACAQAAFATSAACSASANVPTAACETEASGSAYAACVTSSATLFAAWCGGPTDGGAPGDAGTD